VFSARANRLGRQPVYAACTRASEPTRPHIAFVALVSRATFATRANDLSRDVAGIGDVDRRVGRGLSLVRSILGP